MDSKSLTKTGRQRLAARPEKHGQKRTTQTALCCPANLGTSKTARVTQTPNFLQNHTIRTSERNYYFVSRKISTKSYPK